MTSAGCFSDVSGHLLDRSSNALISADRVDVAKQVAMHNTNCLPIHLAANLGRLNATRGPATVVAPMDLML